MFEILVYIAVFAIIAIVVWWILSQVPIPEPLRKILIIVIVVIGAIFLIGVLLNFTGHGGIPLRLGTIFNQRIIDHV